MRKTPKSVCFLTSSDLWPTWLERAAELLRTEVGVEAVHHGFLAGQLGARTGGLPWAALSALKWLERGTYNPTGIDALMPNAKSVQISTALNDDGDLTGWLDISCPDVVICEGDIPLNVIKSIRQRPGVHIWSFDECWSAGVASNFARSVYLRAGSTTIGLWDITMTDETRLLIDTRSQVSSLSMNRTVNSHLLKAAHLPARAMTLPYVEQHADHQPVQRLSGGESLRIAAILSERRIRQKLRPREESAWKLAIATATENAPLASQLESVTEISPPAGRFWADPFLAVDDNKTFLFFEELVHAEGKGKLMVAEVGPDGLRSKPQVVLLEPWHLSYPQVFKHEGNWFMLPESGGAARLDLYIAEDFPFRWKRFKTLMAGRRIFDATLLHHQGLWWLFGNIAENGVSDYDELHIFHSDDLFSDDWKPHPLNPVISDVTRARPAGAFFKFGGKLFRPSQNSSDHYGRGMVINEVLELSLSTYRETIIDQIIPEIELGPYCGIHTFTRTNGMFAVDLIR